MTDWSEVEFLHGSSDAIAAFCDFGYKVIIVTNQRGVATGKIELSELNDIHSRMKEVIASRGGSIAGIYFCPHDISELCRCRKPKAGMLLQAAAEHQLRLPDCWMVGDAETDIAAGKSAGCKTALISQSEGFHLWTLKPDISARIWRWPPIAFLVHSRNWSACPENMLERIRPARLNSKPSMFNRAI